MSPRAAVAGSPVAHSLSPLLHRAAYAALGLSWTYDAVEAVQADLPALLAGNWAGLSLTRPLKQAVLPLLDAVSPLAAATGAVNTVLPGRRGENTDVAGIVTALSEAGVDRPGAAVIVGAGATAASALAALAELGQRTPRVLVRDAVRSRALLAVADQLGVAPHLEQLRAGDLGDAVVISTVPALEVRLTGRGVLLDVVYDPWPTPLAAGWAGPVLPGTQMLLHQAARQVELMTGRPAPVAAMRAALAAR